MKRKSGTGIPRRTIFAMVLLVLLMVLFMGSVSTYAETYSYQQIARSLDRVAENLEKDHFTYSQCGGKSTYRKSKAKRRVTNCALYVSWSLQDVGVLKKGQVFWIEKGGKIHGKPAVIAKNKKVKVLHPRKKAKKAGLQKGDICGWASHTHTAVYAGKDSKGNLLWYSAGRDGGVKKNGKWYFKASKTKAKVRAKRYNGTISTVIRIRNLKKGSPKASLRTSSGKGTGKSTETSNQSSELISTPKEISSGKGVDEVENSKESENLAGDELEDDEVEENTGDEDGIEEDSAQEKGGDEELENVISDEANSDKKREFETEENETAEGIPQDDSVNDEIVDFDKPENTENVTIQNGRNAQEKPQNAKKEIAPSNRTKKGVQEKATAMKGSDSSKQRQIGAPETGDEGFLVMMILFALSCTGLLIVAHSRKPGSY